MADDLPASMVERVARAIVEEIEPRAVFGFDGKKDELNYICVDGHVDMVAVARAAIAAMREPTHDMRVTLPYESGLADLAYRGNAVADLWRLMIDAALEGKAS